ncbi:MAG: 7,8-didemethyl-8-hydroxy-5-deazariboflavin synthase subunit CofG [Methanobrevibacter sp.]|jgi:FO synthase subunit 1|nr:7,8-didemethyl-8-hydroxy-5-deazariboflavin synthase subunit CofG [Candidatus Methanovirga basalitermitum]
MTILSYIEDIEKNEPIKLNQKEITELLNTQKQNVLRLMKVASDRKYTDNITYSKNMFIPLTEVCRNSCGYCTFKKESNDPDVILLKDKDEIIEELKISQKYGCKEALITFGEQADEDELVLKVLNEKGFENMTDYLHDVCEEIVDKTNLLPHSNCGVISYNELKKLKEVNISMGMMIESSSHRLMETIAHKNSPGKNPKLRLEVISNAGRLNIPYTTGILIGIGENKDEIARSLLDIKNLHSKYGHIQEVIIQNFKSKPRTPMEFHDEPTLLDMIRTVSVAKLLFDDVSIQVPPNLNYHTNQIFLLCGADDWGGISPLTKDHVNPYDKWPQISELEKFSIELGFKLKERLAIYDKYINEEYLNQKLLSKTELLKKQLK